MLTLKKRLDLWLPTYALTAAARVYGRIRRRKQLTHIVFLICDHFEPRHGIKHEKQPSERLQTWREQYARFQERCGSSFGTAPLHTWFYPPHHGVEHLASLSEMVFDGMGEVELHYHHDGDTAETLTRDLKNALAEYNRWGFLLSSGERPRAEFGFIHGDWALNNSCAGKYCGVNNETDILRDLGCWGDFTMPSANNCQTRKINSVYYANGDASRPKSHDWGHDAQVGAADPPGFFMMQGPLAINWRAPGYPRIENASLTSDNWGRPDRIRRWLDCQVHVKGRPDWLFVKLHTHGAIERDFDALFGEKAFEMHRVLNEQYNDGRRYRLHYATARQAYNIAKAAEAGKGGIPSDWLDYRIPRQPHSFYALDAPHDLMHCTSDRLSIQNIEHGRPVRLRTRVGPIEQIFGGVGSVAINDTAASVRLEAAGLSSEVAVRLTGNFQLDRIEGGSILERPPAFGDGVWRLSIGPECSIGYRAIEANATVLS